MVGLLISVNVMDGKTIRLELDLKVSMFLACLCRKGHSSMIYVIHYSSVQARSKCVQNIFAAEPIFVQEISL